VTGDFGDRSRHHAGVYMDVRTSLSDTAAKDAENVLCGLVDGVTLGGEHAGVFEGAVPT
jgi:hypothetical protein